MKRALAGSGTDDGSPILAWLHREMDALTKRQLVDATEALHKENDWVATKALWQPYVEQGDLEAQFRLAYYYLFTASTKNHKAERRWKISCEPPPTAVIPMRSTG